MDEVNCILKVKVALYRSVFLDVMIKSQIFDFECRFCYDCVALWSVSVSNNLKLVEMSIVH